MSTLQESVDARRAAKPTGIACVELTSQVPAVIVCALKGPSWALPWSCLIVAECDETDTGEVLKLSFNGHMVTAVGRNLRRVLNDIAGFRVACLRQLPPEYRSRIPADAPFIVGIEVTASEASAPRAIRDGF